MRILKAGALSIGYENGFLRRICFGEAEVLRMIYFALRDHNWNTLDSQITNEIITEKDDGFEIAYDCLNVVGGAVVMEWKARITGSKTNAIVFEITGIARQNFRRNRAGFCVLHPLNIAGQECTLTHPDKTESIRRFPVEVLPDNPFKNVQSMSWKHSGIMFNVSFEGDVFEMEDQRNWGDASYKTFCTPLDKPFPVDLKPGERVFQRIVFKPLGALTPVSVGKPYVSLADTGRAGILPSIGIGASTEAHVIAEAAQKLLRPLRFNHYRVEVHPGKDNWVTDFSAACEDAFAIGCPLEVILTLTDNFIEELEAFTIVCQQNRVKLRNVLLLEAGGLVTGQSVIDHARHLKQIFPGVKFGAGTNYNFNEINKNHFDASDVDYVSFSIDPQEHASDDLTILENVVTAEHLVKSTKSIYGNDKPVHVSPLTLRKRFNPYATNPADLYIDESRKADPRQKEAFCAVWTVGSLCSLVKSGARSATYYQTVGNQGILSHAGVPYPVYDVLKHFTPFQGKAASVPDCSDPLAIQGIVLDGKMLVVANLTDDVKSVRWNDQDITLRPKEIRFEKLNRP